MKVHRGLEQLPTFSNAVLTIGSFDGVHHGHRTIINRLIEKAEQVNGESIILTFSPHPRQVVFPNDKSLRLLNTLEEKIRLLSQTNLDHLIVVPFTVEFSQINPNVYVEEILINKINVQHLIIGYDHKFGLNRGGDIHLLNRYAEKDSFTVEEIAQQDVDELHVSSTKVRNHLLQGEVSKANKLLSKHYLITGKVTKGSQIAGSLGYPTANCTLENDFKLIPAPGTYAAQADCNGQSYEGMLYIGKSPTLQSLDQVMIEMNLFGEVEESLYGKEIIIYPLKRFRNDQKFNSKQELLYNIGQDKIEVEHYFQNKKSDQLATTAVLNFNGVHHLQTYLSSHKQTANNRIAVIDNASTDDSVSWLKKQDIETITLIENEGFAGGYNKGMTEIGSKYVAIVNSDVKVTDAWLDPIISLMESDATIGAVQPKILSVKMPDHYEYAGAAGGVMDMLGYPFCRGRILNTVEKDINQYDQEENIFWASGAAMVMRTSLFKQAGGFDNDFFAHMEEIDLCWRIKKAGFRIAYQPKSIVYHLGGGTLDYESPKKVFLNLRNNYWMILKNKPIASLFIQMPLRVLLDCAYASLFLLKGKPRHFGSALKGIFAGALTNISKKRKRTKFFVNRYKIAKPNVVGMKNVILPISYYLQGKKTFKKYL